MVQQSRSSQEMSGPGNSYQGNQLGYQGHPENRMAVYQIPDDYEHPIKVLIQNTNQHIFQ